MKVRRGFRLRWLAVFCATLAPVANGFAQAIPKFAGTSLPTAPRQAESSPFPENKLPPDAVEAIGSLYGEGLADPRGCEYRQIEVVTGSCWDPAGVTKTHGWVLPATDRPAFAVCWSGLVYPLVSAGPAVDLRADVEAMLKDDEAQLDEQRARYDRSEKQREDQDKRAGREHHRTDWPLRWNTGVAPEATNVASASIRPLKAALLLRLDEADLAARVWSQWFGVKLHDSSHEPYAVLARDWAWALFDRAVCAHMRGDDHLALASAERLIAVQPVIEARATESRAASSKDSGNADKPVRLLDFLKPLPELLADQRRRAAEPVRAPVLSGAIAPGGSERIAALIRDLELVSARQWGQPGGVNLAGDPVVQALIGSGDDAVEPLLGCLENDTRLTRSVRFHRDFFPSRTILGVHEAAYVALANILHADFFGVGSTGDSLTAHGQQGRHEVAGRIRAYWQKNQGFSLPERWYRTLGDDTSPPGEWLQAADNIVQDDNVAYTRSSMSGGIWTTASPLPAGRMPATRGEALRAKVGPSVSDLLVKRMAAFAAPMNQVPDTNLRRRAHLALVLAEWDGKNHLDDFRSVSELMKTRAAASKGDREQIIEQLLALYQARIRAGDPAAVADYAGWVPTVPRKDGGFATRTLFEILWQHPADPAVRAAAEKLFAGKDSPRVPFLEGNTTFIHDLASSPLVGLEAFRTELSRGLSNTARAGSATLDGEGDVNVAVDDGWSGGGGGCFNDPAAPPVGTVVPFRVCDLYAYEVSQLEGAPRCQLVWPRDKKDDAVAACARFLRQYGDRFQYQPGDENETDVFHRALLHLPPLDHPATPQDVEQGRAIFALEGERRVWKMPAFPMRGSWTTLKDNPSFHQEIDADGKRRTVIDYQTAGKVFQAEEKLVGGRWERFYGFVGPSHMTKVPAAEIRFSPDNLPEP